MYSGKQVIKAGETLLIPNLENKNPQLFSECMDVLSFWRFTHENALAVAFDSLVKATLPHDRQAIFAKRLKRYPSIVSKLRRFENMKLKNMQDIGGCRAIVKDEKRLRKVVKELKKLPTFKFENGQYKSKDYIKKPKQDGYRGYHLIGKFGGENGQTKSIELQVRTKMQHSWATALEIVDLFTGQALKSNIGTTEWKDFFSSTSEQFALIESIPMYSELEMSTLLPSYAKKLGQSTMDIIYSNKLCQHYIKKLDIFERFAAFANSLRVIENQLQEIDTDTGYVLISIDTFDKNLTTTMFSNDEEGNKDAEKFYIEAEKQAASKQALIVALVSSSNVASIKDAYPNYFADSTSFLEYLEVIEKIENPIKLQKVTRKKLAIEL